MIDVTIANLEQQVIEASMTTPVLVDFWSPRSTPCKSLGPVLEKLEAEYAGRFVLAKVNSDVESEVAAMFGVRNVPTCVLMVQGRAVDGFTGAQPEPQIRALLDKHLAPAAAPEPEPELLDEDDDALLARMKNEVEMDASNDDKRFFYVKLLLELGHVDEAKAAFAPAIGKAAGIRRLDSLQRWMHAIDAEQASPADMPALDAAIAANKRDFAARFARAQALLAQQQFTAALDELLEILMRDKAWDEDKARKTYIAILDLMEQPKAPVAEGQIPQEDPTIATYRRRLSSVVLS